MTTAAQAIPQQKFEVSAQEFYDQLNKKYPTLAVDSTVPILIAQLKEMGLFIEFVSVAALWGAFYAAVSANKLTLPPVVPVLDDATIERIRAKFPPVIKSVPKELSQREKSALAGVPERGSGRATAAERRSESKRIEDSYRQEREKRAATSLRSEFRKALADAEMLTGRTHSESATLRKEAVSKVMADPKYLSVRDSK